VRVILSISSDIGTALAIDWIKSGHKVAGTYRTWSSNCSRLSDAGVTLYECDFASRESISTAANSFNFIDWEVLVLAAGTQEPIGLFAEVDFDSWEESLSPNFTGMLRFLHQSLNRPTNNSERTVIFFAGGGTNNATERYSAYTIAKIASIKMCELLDYENPDTKFTILGPGWVDTKIHNATLQNSENAGENFKKTQTMLRGTNMNPIENVIECCNWVVEQPKKLVGGRNFSVVHDAWRSESLLAHLESDSNLYKLRRSGNDLVIEVGNSNE
jgi:NAD(P)-dependent dehydrogenase (short-subunit alcohol dehydrogenase family)